ncbi:hypothetical protein H2199_001829 [Coniosporium tulheliwenetii]|uniref:Uncharacterized protein n=1 Tax=Coniosporium tulheliwenetii TaxID=3383036 RepID=A0ACC2ZKD9_9PEZI|nr:hypothetical protein H2199_001829 [Cladosporium sp. JES 115]
MTRALKTYNLSTVDLFHPHLLGDTQNRPRIRCALYEDRDVDAAVFFKHEMERLATFVHGDDPLPAREERQKERNNMNNRLVSALKDDKWCKKVLGMSSKMSKRHAIRVAMGLKEDTEDLGFSYLFARLQIASLAGGNSVVYEWVLAKVDRPPLVFLARSMPKKYTIPLQVNTMR